ncbi:MAG: DUF1559 domain-containing protein [Gemmataceae bacterium]|nr:DUF1559 domain-containing protein [Gemmataceae bacterium]
MRRAFTLMELIVVLVIVAVLIGLLLPAVRRVNHAATVMRCQNNLKQVGLALHNHHDTFGHFPPGAVPHPELPADERLSWQFTLLPFLEEQKAHDYFDPDSAWDDPRNAAAARHFYPQTLSCPASFGSADDRGRADYVGLAGVGADVARFPLEGPGVGFFGFDCKLKVEDVTDGLAHTLAVYETSFQPGPFVRGGPSTVRGLDLSDAPHLGQGRPMGGLHKRDRTFGRPKPLGCTMLLADASVRLSPAEMSADVLSALATVAGGETVPADW